MIRAWLLNVIVLISCGNIFSQVTSFKIGDQYFVKADIETLSFLTTHIDSVEWNNKLLPIGFKSVPANKKATALEYTKEANGVYEYINFDDRYMVLTIIWKDASGKNIITKELKKTLKKKEYNSSGTYKINHNGFDFVISLDSNKEKTVYEMITVEQERK